MAAVAAHYLGEGRRVAVFGLDQDDTGAITGEHIDTREIATLPDALAGCRVIIGTDSGVTHLASSLGVPVVVVYTATSPIKGDPVGMNRKIFKPLPCSPCQSTPGWQGCNDWRCRDIDPTSVIEAADISLEKARQR
jgi:ADP-heptose:LPS heptosyltransferase